MERHGVPEDADLPAIRARTPEERLKLVCGLIQISQELSAAGQRHRAKRRGEQVASSER